ncbi:hypothetical protein MX112_04590 [Streptococcus uberis]|nr:hypothetical protein [Streptococcus uberis]
MFYDNTLNLKQELGGYKIKQGDFGSVLSFILLDGNGSYIDELNQKTASISLCTDDKILYVTTATINNSTVEFKIDKAIPVGVYYVEIKVDNYIFPSDRSTIISIEQGATVYDLKDLIPNYDVSMTLTDILNKLNVKDGQVVDLQNKMNAIYSNALSDHTEILNAKETFATLDSRLDGLDAEDSDLQNQINANKTNISSIDSRLNTVVASAGSGKDSEVVDARTDEQGNVFNSLGEAVRNKVSYKPGANLIDTAHAVMDYYVSATAGAKNANADFQYNTINSIEGITYYLVPTAGIHVAFFNSNNTFINGLVDPKSFITPTGTKYFTVSYPSTKSGEIMLSKSPILAYEAFYEGIDGNEILRGTISGDKLLPDLKMKVENAVSKTVGVNIIDKNSATTGYYISASAGSKNVMASYQYNNFTATPDDVFYINFATGVHFAFFDSTAKFISGAVDPKPNITVPTNAVTMSISYQIAHKDTIVVSKVPVNQYVPHEVAIPGSEIATSSISKRALDAELASLVGADKKIILVGPGQQYTSLLKAISENTTTINTYKLVNAQIDMKQEYLDHYGPDFFTNYVDYSGSDFNKRGYNLKIGDNLIADPKSKIVWNYDASNVNVNTWFSPLNLTINNNVDGLNIDVITDYSCRYIVHDDFAWDNDGKNHVSNCHFKGRSYFFQIVGAGMSTNSEYLYENCKFEDSGNPVDPSNTKEQLAYTIHNNSKAGAKNNVKLKDCWTSPNLSIRATYYGQSTEISELTVTNCKTKSVYTKAHTVDGTSPNVNVQLFDWNNPLWTT